ALGELGGELAGQYLPLPSSSSCMARPAGMLPEESQMLESKGFLFKADEPDGRGIFAVDALAAAVLVNNGSHVQILVNQDGTSQEASSLLLESFRSALEGALHQDGHAMIAQG
ncbi:unnamed protein product, partial [Polarella glacialis]